MRVVLAGGGTAGHIEPALAVADALRQADPRAMIICLGTERGLETRLVPMRGYELAMIPAVPLPRSVTPAPARGAGQAGRRGQHRRRGPGPDEGRRGGRLRRVRGHPRLPGGPAPARADRGARGQPPPRAGQQAGRPADRARVHRAPRTPSCAHATYLGIPIRREIADLDRLGQGDKARAHFGLRPDLPVLLVTGGSQGARSLNSALYGAIDWLRSAGVQILHVDRAAQRGGGAASRRARRTWRCRTWTGWTWPTPPPTSRCAGPAP